MSASHGKMVRWYAAYGSFGIPAAAGPISFALAALALTGNANDGALIVLAMTLAQILGAVPIARLGRTFRTTTYLRLLIVIRGVAFAALAAFFYFRAPIAWLAVAAVGAGLVNGAAYGYLRATLNGLVSRERLPRALGIASTLNEVTFVAAPVMASLLGAISPIFGLTALTVLGLLPLVLAPDVQGATYNAPSSTKTSLSPAVLLWLLCALTNAAVIASIEVGAVALALHFGFKPEFGALFTVSLCFASVAGGVFVSVRNRIPGKNTVVGYLCLLMLGAVLVALRSSVELTTIGAFLVGIVLAPLGTYYSLMLDHLSEPDRRAEMFALQRTANAIGVMTASGILAVFGLSSALATGIVLAVVATTAVILAGTGALRSLHAPPSDR